MLISKLILKPGDKVRYVKNGFESNDPQTGICLRATKGSFATVVSYNDYRPVYERRFRQLAPENHISTGRDVYFDDHIVTDVDYPVRLEQILPPSQLWEYVPYKVGDIVMEHVASLEKMYYLNPVMILVIQRVRLILPGDDTYLKPHLGHQLLVLEYTLENESGQRLSDRLIPRAWLTPGDTHNTALVISATPTLHGGIHISGQVIFEIPEHIRQYIFRLELPDVGSIETDIVVQDLKIGDTICLKGNTYASHYDYFLSARPYDGYPSVDPFFIPDSQKIIKNSTGILVPFTKFRAAYVRQLERLGRDVVSRNRAAIEVACARVKIDMEEGLAYPVELKRVELPASPDRWTKYCQEGEILVISALALKKASIVQEPYLTLEWVRTILPDDDHPRRPRPGYRLLLIDFTFEHLDFQPGLTAPSPQLRLAYTLSGGGARPATIVKPVSVTLPNQVAWQESGFVGQVIFEVPKDSDGYDLSLEIATMGTWSKTIHMPVFQPGDRIRTTRDYYAGSGERPTMITGSLGRIVSFTEYRADYNRLGKLFDQDERQVARKWAELEHLCAARDKMAEDQEYPVRLEKIRRPSHEDTESPLQEGDIIWLRAYFFEKSE